MNDNKKLNKRIWTKPFRVNGDPPSPRCSHGACLMQGKIFIYGGWSGSDFLSDFYVYQIDTCTWSKPITSGETLPRAGHSVTSVGTKIFIFGGGDGIQYYDDIQILDLETMTWPVVETKGQGPSPRCQHTANFYEGKIYFFGGGDSNTLYNDLYVLDAEILEWSKPRVKNKAPSCRWGHTSTLVENQLYIFGGNNGKERLNDTYILDLESLTWTRAPINKRRGKSPAIQPLPRAGHTANFVNGKIYIYGGGDGILVHDFNYLTISNMLWTSLEAGNGPDLCAHSSEIYGNRLIVFGGSNGLKCFNDLYYVPLGKLRAKNSKEILRGAPNTTLASKLSFRNHQRRLSYHVNNMANRTMINKYFQNGGINMKPLQKITNFEQFEKKRK